jgi:type IV pilus assembly protein PilE
MTRRRHNGVRLYNAVRPRDGLRPQNGFTLVELAVTMVLVAIVTAIAIPSYSNYVRQSRRTDAKSAILDLASLEERYFSTANAYTNLAANLGYAAPGSTATLTNQVVGSGYYTVSIPTPTAATATTPAGYTITATAIGDQLKDTSCYSFTVTQNGTRTALNSASADNTANCW